LQRNMVVIRFIQLANRLNRVSTGHVPLQPDFVFIVAAKQYRSLDPDGRRKRLKKIQHLSQFRSPSPSINLAHFALCEFPSHFFAPQSSNVDQATVAHLRCPRALPLPLAACKPELADGGGFEPPV